MSNTATCELVGEPVCTGVLTTFKKIMRHHIEQYMIGNILLCDNIALF
jgi:hypothetical protein